MPDQTAVDTTDELTQTLEQGEALDLDQMMSKSARGAISFFIRTAILQGVGLASMLILSAYLTPEDFGVFGVVMQIIGILVFFSDIGLAAALIQKKENPTTAEYRTAFTVQQILGWVIVGVALAIVSTGWIQGRYGAPAAWVLMSLALSFPLAAGKTISSILLERQLNFSKVVGPQIVEQLVFHGLLIGLAIKGMGVMAYTYAILVRSVVGLVAMWLVQPWSIGLALDKAALKNLFHFGAKFQINDLLARIKDQLFYLVLARFMTTAEFGYMSWAKNWSLYPYNLTVQNVMAVTFPTFSRLQGNQAALKRAIEKSLFFISLAIFPILVGMCVLIGPLTEVIPKYGKWQPAVWSFVFFTLSIGWAAISTPLTNTLNAIGHINTTLKLMIIWTVLTWAVTPVMMWWFGFTGVAVAALVISFTSFLPIYFVKKIVPIAVWENVWRPLVAAAGMAVVGWLGQGVWSQSIWMWLFGGGVLAVTYLVVLLGVGKDKLVAEVQGLRKKSRALR